MQRPFPREEAQLSEAEFAEFELLTSGFERVEEHVLSWALIPQIYN